MFTDLDSLLENSTQKQWILKNAVATGGVGGRMFSQWSLNGVPAAGSFDTTRNGSTISWPVDGAIDLGRFPSNGFSAYLSSAGFTLTTQGGVIIADRLWQGLGDIAIDDTDLKTLTTPTWPSRDQNGSTDGVGVYIGVEVITQTNTGTPSFTISYTNSDGVSGRTATNIYPTVAASAIGNTYLFELQGDDKGVRSVESFQQTNPWSSGSFCLVALRPLLMLDVNLNNRTSKYDSLTAGQIPIFANSALYTLYCPQNSTTSNLSGYISWAFQESE